MVKKSSWMSTTRSVTSSFRKNAVIPIVLLLLLSQPLQLQPIDMMMMVVVVTATTTSIPSTIINRQQQQQQQQQRLQAIRSSVSPSVFEFWSSSFSSNRMLQKLHPQIYRGGNVIINTDNNTEKTNEDLLSPPELEPQLQHPPVLFQQQQEQIDSYKQSGIDLYKQHQNFLHAAIQFQTAIQLLLVYPIHINNRTHTTCLQDILGIVPSTTTTTITTTTGNTTTGWSTNETMNARTNITTTTTTDFIESSSMLPLTTSQVLQEYATLILHETLCYIQYMEMIQLPQESNSQEKDLLQLLQQQYMDQVIHETTTLLDAFQTYITTTPPTMDDNANDVHIDNNNNIHSSDTDIIPIYIPVSIVTAIRARAHYRRSKAMYYKIQLLQQQQQQQQESPSSVPNATIVSTTIRSTNIGTDTKLHNSNHHENNNTTKNHDHSTISTTDTRTATTTIDDDGGDDDTKNNSTNPMDVLEVDHYPEDKSNQDMIDQLEANMYNDVRIAAYLGDKKAVQWYGQRMRHPRSSSCNMNNNGHSRGDHSSSDWDDWHKREEGTNNNEGSKLSSASVTSTTTTSSSASDTTANNNLLSSLLMGGDTNDNSSSSSTTTNVFSQMLMSSVSSSLPGSSTAGFNPIQSLARSMLQRITNDVQFQASICQFLQNVSMQQVQQYLQLFGLSNFVTLPGKYVEPIIQFCHAITLIRLQRMIFFTKCMNYCRKIVQRIFRIIHRYHTVIVLYFVSIWIQSSVKRPIPISKKMQRRLQHPQTLLSQPSLIK